METTRRATEREQTRLQLRPHGNRKRRMAAHASGRPVLEGSGHGPSQSSPKTDGLTGEELRDERRWGARGLAAQE